jgi:hypothetical protein
MDKTTKTILIVIGSLVVLCACTFAALLGTGIWSFSKVVQFADQNTTEDPQKVAQIASEIAEFDLPEGFTTQYGMKIAAFSMVQYTTRSEDTYIFLAQFPAQTSINPEEMMREINNGARDPSSPWHNMDTTLVEQKSIMIRGEETTLSIGEGINDKGILYRIANARFQGNGEGPALLLVVAPADQWDSKMVTDFAASLR